MKIAVMFPGQGAQKEKMGIDFYENDESFRKILDEISNEEIISILKNASLEEISKTENTQPAMVAFELALWERLKQINLSAEYFLGLSLGEYSALAASSILEAKEAVEIASYRGKFMEEVAREKGGAMMAVLSLDEEKLSNICKSVNDLGFVHICNYNTSNQLVISGDEKAVEKVGILAKESGARRCIKLNVSGAFHTPNMREAGEKLRKVLETKDINSPKYKTVFNVSAREIEDFSKEKVINNLEKQISSPIFFEKSIKYIIEKGITDFLEVGPSKVLSGFVRKISKEARVRNVETLEDFKSIQETISQGGDIFEK